MDTDSAVSPGLGPTLSKREKWNLYQNQYQKNRKDNDPQHRYYVSSKISAIQRGLDHNIEKTDIVIPEFCPVFGTKLIYGGRFPNSASIDRIDSTKGYVKGNVRIISFRANRLKNNGTLEDFRAIVKYLEAELDEDNSTKYLRSEGRSEEVQRQARSEEA